MLALALLAGMAKGSLEPTRISLTAGWTRLDSIFSEYDTRFLLPRADARAEEFRRRMVAEGFPPTEAPSSQIQGVMYRSGVFSDALDAGVMVTDRFGAGLRCAVTANTYQQTRAKSFSSTGAGSLSYWGFWDTSTFLVQVMPGGWLEGGKDGAGGMAYRLGIYAGPAVFRLADNYDERKNDDQPLFSYKSEAYGVGYAAEFNLGTDFWLTDHWCLSLNGVWRLGKIGEVDYSSNVDTNNDGATDVRKGSAVRGNDNKVVPFDIGGWKVLAGITWSVGAPRRPLPRRADEPVRRAPASTERPPADRTNIAVMGLEAQGVSASDAGVISDILRGELVKTKAFNVVEKQNMDKVLAEQGFQQTGCTSSECAVKLGRVLNTRKIVVGSFGKLMGKNFISVRVIDVETGNADFSDDAKGDTVEDVIAGVRRIAGTMAVEVR